MAWRYVRVPLAVVIGFGVLFGGCLLSGFLHIHHGGGGGIGVCLKTRWNVRDTFVDLDDYVGKSILENIDKAHIMKAMFSCGALTPPPGLRESAPKADEVREPVRDDPTAKMERLADEMCACPDAECAAGVMDRAVKASEANAGKEVSASAADRYERSQKRLIACMERIAKP
ncbi:MAG: hypothetical protein KIT31_33180 [Deltaproteobacteria bacterium]|nr:hypothetical protein [Deltaproteobacteria bacterium]